MDFMTAVKTCFAKYVDFSGRATRSEYWWFVLAQVIASIILQILSNALFGLIGVLGLVFLLPGIAAGARRLHDIGKSGWFLLLCFIPLVNLYLIYLLVQPTQPGSNAYGAPPVA